LKFLEIFNFQSSIKYGGRFGKKISKNKSIKKTQVQSENIQPLSHLRQAKGIFKEIWNLSYLFSKSRFPRKASWRGEIKLVMD